MKEIRHLSTFTGSGDVSINAFISSTEFYLNGINDDELRKTPTGCIFYEKIQGGPKDVIINIPRSDSWERIKSSLGLRYKSDTEPFEIYRTISNIKANTVSQLAIKIQQIKYKKDESAIYYNNYYHIDLSNANSILVSTSKEMTQGVLLDKILEIQNIGRNIEVMNNRKFEDSCIRSEYRKVQSEN